MPPKSKKEQQEEAKRLQEEQKRKQEEEAKLALERKRYANQVISTGLLLPASAQLIIDATTQSSAHIIQKLHQNLISTYPNLQSSPTLLKLVKKELLHYIVETLGLFKLTNIKMVQKNEEQLLKARVLVGICLRLMLNEHQVLSGQGKSKARDEQLFKQLLSLHVQRGQGKLKLYSVQEVQSVLNTVRNAYFNHFVLLFNFDKFKARQSTLESYVYLSTPTIV